MEKFIIKDIIIKEVSFSLVILIGCCLALPNKPCHLYSEQVARLNQDLTPPLTYRAIISENTTCTMDLNRIYPKIISKLTEKEMASKSMYIGVTFNCIKQSINITFNSFSGTLLQRPQMELSLFIGNCSILVEDLTLFQQIGNLFGLMFFGSIQKMPLNKKNCQFAQDLVALSCEMDCKTGTFFWEKCSDVFNNLYWLELRGCAKHTISWKFARAQEKFPMLESLSLENMNVEGMPTFTWKKSATESNTEKVHNKEREDKILKYLPTKSFQVRGRGHSVISNFNLNGIFHYMIIKNVTDKNIPKDIFKNVKELNYLGIFDNMLESFDEKLFKGLTSLTTLDLRNNNLQYIPDNTFQDLTNVTELYLDFNNISSISDKLFKPLVSIQKLLLNHNNIKHLPPNIFQNQRKLTELYLNNNPLVDIPIYPLYLPYIVIIDMHQTDIDFNSLRNLSRDIKLENIGVPFGPHSSFEKKIEEFEHDPSPKLDLSSCKVTEIPILQHKPSPLFFLSRKFNINMEKNPLSCFCYIFLLKYFIMYLTAAGTKWQLKCFSPPELQGRLIDTLTDNEILCPVSLVNVTNCPQTCTCSYSIDKISFTIDCRNTNMTKLPAHLLNCRNSTMAPDKYKLLFKNSSLVEINYRYYLSNVTFLDVSDNRIHFIDPNAVMKLQHLDSLYLDSNHLHSLPKQVQSLSKTEFTLGNNPYMCDCTNKWMKYWIFSSEALIKDWTEVQCTDQNGNLEQMIAVPDGKFVCLPKTSWSIAKHVVLPSVLVGSVLLVLVIISLLIYFQRFNVKVLLFMKFGFHPFNKTEQMDGHLKYDAFIVYDSTDTVFIQENVLSYLEDKGYKVADMYRDFVVGVSYLENIQNMINVSKRVIFCLNEKALASHLIRVAWTMAYERATDLSMKSIILIADGDLKKLCTDDSILNYLRYEHYINWTAKLLQSSIEYLMPNQRTTGGLEMEQRNLLQRNPHDEVHENDITQNIDTVFLLYPDDVHDYIMNTFIPFLKAHNFDPRLTDHEFPPGTDIRDEIVQVLHKACYFIIFLSEELLYDEVKMFIISNAITKAFLSDYNYVLLVTKGPLALDIVPTEICNYTENFVTISLTSDRFEQCILESLKYRNEN